MLGSMPRENSVHDFGLLISYLVPGAVVLLGLRPFSPTLQGWFATASVDTPTIGGFLYLTVASLAAGMTVSAVRWAAVDTLHAHTGLPPEARLLPAGRERRGTRAAHRDPLQALPLLREHVRGHRRRLRLLPAALGGPLPPGWPDLAFVGLEAVFLATSRDTLRKYYARSGSSSPPGARAVAPCRVSPSLSPPPSPILATRLPGTPRMPRASSRSPGRRCGSSRTSSRLSPRSTLLTNDWVWPTLAASSTWVSPASSRRPAEQAEDALVTPGCRSFFPSEPCLS